MGLQDKLDRFRDKLNIRLRDVLIGVLIGTLATAYVVWRFDKMPLFQKTIPNFQEVQEGSVPPKEIEKVHCKNYDGKEGPETYIRIFNTDYPLRWDNIGCLLDKK